MAYYDANGNITIDEDAAFQDIQRAAQAENILRSAVRSLKNVNSMCSEFQGSTAQAIVEKSTELQRKAERLISELDEMQSYTRRVIERYRRIDEECKRIIEQSTNTTRRL